MDRKNIRVIGATVIVAIWAIICLVGWFGPKAETSTSERRPLTQMPQITIENILDGKFMSTFEDFTLDQFPLRDTFRQLKSLFHYYVLNQSDNNDIYIAGGHAAKLDYPVRQSSVDYALKKFQSIYDKYLQNCDVTQNVL